MRDGNSVEGRGRALEPREWEARVALGIFTAVVVAVETTALLVSMEVSAACYAALLVALLNLPLIVRSLTAQERAVVMALALVPALKIAAVALPQLFVPARYWEALSALMALALVFALRIFAEPSLSAARTAWIRLREPEQLAIAAAGPVMAVAAAAWYSAVNSGIGMPGIVASSTSALATAALSGVALEIVFRGVIQASLIPVLGRAFGVAVSSFLYAALFIGSGSSFLIVLALVTGAVWGTVAATTRTVTGVAVSHAFFAMFWVVLY